MAVKSLHQKSFYIYFLYMETIFLKASTVTTINFHTEKLQTFFLWFWNLLFGLCLFSARLVAVHRLLGRLLTDKLRAFGKMLSSSRAHLQLWQPAAPAKGSSYLHYLLWVSHAHHSGSCFSLPHVEISQLVPEFPFSLIRQRKILSWIMRHWTEVLFVSQAKVSIALLADGLSPKWQASYPYCASVIIEVKLVNYLTTFPFCCKTGNQ